MYNDGRSREGAWIEITPQGAIDRVMEVAPARERGLKYRCRRRRLWLPSRSREGAWIEISVLYSIQRGVKSLPRGSVD